MGAGRSFAELPTAHLTSSAPLLFGPTGEHMQKTVPGGVAASKL